MENGDELSVEDGRLARTVLIYKKSMLHPKAHPQAVLEALQDMAAAVSTQLRTDDGKWKNHDLGALLKATDMGKVVNGLCKYPNSRHVAALAKQVLYAWKHTIANYVLGISDGEASASTNSLSPEDPEYCPASPHVYVIIDDDAADEVLVPPPYVVPSAKTQRDVAAFPPSPAPAQQAVLAKSNMQSCRPLEVMQSDAVPAPAPIGRKRPLDMSPIDVKSTPLFCNNQASAMASYEAKLEASRHKLHMGYEREKRQHTVCLVHPDQLPRDNMAASKRPAIPKSHQHDQRNATSGSIQALAPQRPVGPAAPHYPAAGFVRAY